MSDYEKTNKQATAWTEASERYAISAREYFYILRLALCHVAGIKTDNSYEVSQAMETATPEVYECALDILNAMYKVTIELRKNYWVIHTDHYGKDVVCHTKQVMCEVWRDGKIREEPLTSRYVLTHDEFSKAMDAYNWNEVLGEPEDYIRKENEK